MTKIISLAVEARDRAGKGTARATRRDGRVPAVIYGNKQPAQLISLEYNKFFKELHRPGFFTHLFDLTLAGESFRVLPRDVQFDPVTDRPLHVDFLRVSETTEIIVKVPVEFVNQEACPGLKKGGTLNIVRHDLELHAKANAIPEKIIVDLTGVDLNASIHISAVTLPEGVRPTVTDRDFTIATLVPPLVGGGEG